jgi:hypothetical protein
MIFCMFYAVCENEDNIFLSRTRIYIIQDLHYSKREDSSTCSYLALQGSARHCLRVHVYSMSMLLNFVAQLTS